jgi:hypothetical protein
MEQEAGRQFRPAEPPGRFAEAGRREVEQAEALEERGIIHGRVERRDQLLGGIQFCLGNPRVLLEGISPFLSVRRPL